MAESVTGSKPRGAVCVIKVDGKLLVVHEVITDKISLPGGALSPGESSKQAALRELLEEAGIEATATRLLPFSDNYTHLFECLPKRPVVALNTTNYFGGNTVPIAHAEHYAIESQSAMLLPIEQLDPQSYRYPERVSQLTRLVPHLVDTPAQYVASFMSEEGGWRGHELALLAHLHGWLTADDSLAKRIAVSAVVLVDLVFSPVLLILLLPLIYWRMGRVLALELLFVTGSVSLLAICIQYLISSPLPAAYVGSFSEKPQFGFSLPHSELAVLVAMTSLVNHRTIYRAWFWPTLLLAVYACSQWLLGKAFVGDLVLAVFIGAISSKVIEIAEDNLGWDMAARLSSWRVWLGLLCVCGAALGVWQVPPLVNCFILLFTLAALVRLRLVADSVRGEGLSRIISMSVALTLVFIILLIVKGQFSVHSHQALLYNAMIYPTLMITLVLMLPKRSKEDPSNNSLQK